MMDSQNRDPLKAYRKNVLHRPDGGRRESGSCFKRCCCPMAVFVIIFGAAFVVIFGLIPIDNFQNLFGWEIPFFGGKKNEDNEGDRTDPPTLSPTDPSQFSPMLCPENGECCNGLASICDLKPNEIVWPTVHNAMHDDLLGNNQKPLEDALQAGYRGLQLDVCVCEDPDTKMEEIVFCHSFCIVGRRSFDEVFPNINTFLNDNPSEMVLINLEISVGDPTPEEIWDAIQKYQGLKAKTYIHSGNDFPTMRELEQSGKRLLLFKHNGIDCSNISTNGCSNRIAEFHKYTVETEWDFEDNDAVADFQTSCAPNRGIDGEKNFYQINHFVTRTLGPSIEAAKVINARDFLEERITQCEKITNQEVNIVAKITRGVLLFFFDDHTKNNFYNEFIV